MRRWDAMPDLEHAELIDGIVYMASPVTNTHGVFHSRLTGWLLFYEMATPGCKANLGTTHLMTSDSVPQPDVALRILPEFGGQSSNEGDYPAGAPELIVEISHTTSARDSGVKLRLYERSGVREYIIVRPSKKQIAWRELLDGKYQEIAPDADGLYRSRIFPGLWMDPAALWAGDLNGLAAAVKHGTATPEHAAFASALAAKK